MKKLFWLFLLAAAPLVAEDARELVREGEALSRQLQTQEALAAFLRADAAAPGQVDTLCRIAREYALSMEDVTREADRRERGEKALFYARRALSLDANSAEANLSVAVCCGRLAPLSDNRTKIAYSKQVKEHAEKALKLNPNDDITYYVLGAWNYELANLNLFMRTVATALYGKLPAASYQEALRLLQKATALNPERLGNHVELGKIYLALGQKENGRAALQKALAMPSREKDDEHEKAAARRFLKGL